MLFTKSNMSSIVLNTLNVCDYYRTDVIEKVYCYVRCLPYWHNTLLVICNCDTIFTCVTLCVMIRG